MQLHVLIVLTEPHSTFHIPHSTFRIPFCNNIKGDLGQTEFTPSGLTSLHTVTEPIFGPSYMHQRTPSAVSTQTITPLTTPPALSYLEEP